MKRNLFKEQVSEAALNNLIKMAAQLAQLLSKHVRQMIAAKTYQPKTTHQIRILSRKCAMAIRVLSHAGVDIDKHKTVNCLRGLRQCLGPLRDGDILQEEFQDFASKRKTGGNDDALVGAIQQAWLQRYVNAVAQLAMEWPTHRKTLASLQEQLKRLNKSSRNRHWRNRDDRWVKKQLTKWSRYAETMKKNEQELHGFRIKTKRLRYLLQCLLPQKIPALQRAWLTRLEELQQDLGRCRDLQNIIDWLDNLREGILFRQEEHRRLLSSIDSWRKNCQLAIRRQEKQLVKLRSQLTLNAK